MALGSDGLGSIEFDDYELARTIGIIALALILFEGGLAAGLPEIRPVLGSALSLALARHAADGGRRPAWPRTWLLDLTLLRAMLVGSIVSATDGAAIFALLRGSTLKRRLARTLEGEAGHERPGRGPARARLHRRGSARRTTACWTWPGCSCSSSASARSSARPSAGSRCRRSGARNLATGGLYPVASLAVVAIAFGAADVLHGSGFLAVYLAGLAMGSVALPARQTVAAFHDGLAWLAQLAMFFTLGLLVFPSRPRRRSR